MSIQSLEEQGGAQSVQDAIHVIISTGTLNGLHIPASPSNKTSSSPSSSSDVRELSSQPAVSAQSQYTNTSLATANDVPNPKICGVCKEKEYKYKCSRCFLPYCSIACSTLHRATHPAAPSPSPAPPPEPKPEQPKTAPRAGTLAAAGQAGPFAGLDDSAELRALFKHYPNLHFQLNQIYTAMQPPKENTPNMYEKLTGKHNHQKTWNQDRGLEKGRQALGRAREAWSKDGEGIREYGELVLRIVEGVDSKELVRRELDRENARIVRALLDGEL